MNSDERTSLSRLLSKILRHKALDEGLILREDGFISLPALLSLPKLQKLNATIDRVQQVVQADAKTRFTLREEADGNWWIRANQGHSIPVTELELVQITDAKEFPVVLHGTYLKHWHLIQYEGLKKMGRNHIHLATGKFGESGVTSGIRKSCNLFIYINLHKAMNDGIIFSKSSNGVILTSGVNGTLPSKYFSKVESTDPIFTYTPMKEEPEIDIDKLSITTSHLQLTKPRLLFGGTIELPVPSTFIDASDIRQIPDSQEVFLDPDTDTCCLIVELTESIQEQNEEAARKQFNALSEDSESAITAVSRVPTKDSNMEAWIVDGSQRVPKFNQSHNIQDVKVTLGLIRIPKVSTDVLVTYYQGSKEQSGGNTEEAGAIIRYAVEQFRILDWNLFPEMAE